MLIEENKRLIEDGNFYQKNKNKLSLTMNEKAYQIREEKLAALNKKLGEDKGILSQI